MTKPITTAQVLELLSKATKLLIHYSVYDYEETDEYAIQFEVDWYADEHETYRYEKVIISKENDESSWKGDWSFNGFMTQLDEKLKEQEQKRIKAEKRKELIARLTDEEKELLNLK